MRAIYALRTRTLTGWLSGDVLLNTRHEPCAFVRDQEVFTFTRRHVGIYADGAFRDAGGSVVGTLGDAPVSRAQGRNRRRRFQITPRIGFSVPAPRPSLTSRSWAIRDRAIDTFTT